MGLGRVGGVELLHPNKARQRARDLNRGCPPDDYLAGLVQCNRPRRRALTDAEGTNARVSQKAEGPFTDLAVLPAILAP